VTFLTRVPRPGDVLRVTRAASVQFSGDRALRFRVIRVHDWTTYRSWVWLDGYVLDRHGEAVDRRTIYVQPAGLWLLGPRQVPVQRRPVGARRPAVRRPDGRAVARLPAQPGPPHDERPRPPVWRPRPVAS